MSNIPSLDWRLIFVQGRTRFDLSQIWSRKGIQARHDAIAHSAWLHLTTGCRRIAACNVPITATIFPRANTDDPFSLAGSDTTGTAIRMTFLHLMTNPHAYHKLYHECTSTDIPLDTIIAQSRTLSLPYLQAVVREGLRIYPSAVGLSPKIAPPGGDTLEDGTYIPAGTQVGIASWSIYHNKSVYGPDADIFRPERWIESSEVQVAEMKRSLELLFGYGRFKCLGQNVAMMELPKVIFELVRRFEWSLEDPLRPLGRNRCYGLFLQRGMWVNVGLCPPRGRHPEIADKVAVSKRA